MILGVVASSIKKTSTPAVVGKPLLSNFRIDNAQQSRLYFDASASIVGLTVTGFYINERSLTLTINGDNLGGYFTSTTSFKYGEIVTIELRSGNGIVDDFPKDYVVNNIVYSGTQKWVTATASGSGNGDSEATAWNMTQLNAASLTAPIRVNIKKGNYSGTFTPKNGNSTTKEFIVYEGYNATPGDMNYNVYHPAHGDTLNANFMPLFTGAGGSTNFVDFSTRTHVIFKNIQITNYHRAFNSFDASLTKIYWDNVVMTEGGSDTYANAAGLNLGYTSASNPPNAFIRVVNCLIKNYSSTNMTICGNDAFVYNTKTYSDRLTNAADTDYMMAIHSGDYVVIRNCHVEKIGNTGHDGHGLAFRTIDPATSLNWIRYSTIINSTAKNIDAGIQLRHANAQWNKVIGCTVDGSGGNNSTAGVSIRDGASYNIVDGCKFINCESGIAFSETIENLNPDVYAAYDNTIQNCIFDNVGTAILNSIGTSATRIPATNNKVYNCTFKNIYTRFFYKNADIINLQLANNIVVDSPGSYEVGSYALDETWTNSIFNNNAFATPTGGTTFNPQLNSSYQPQAAFTSVDASKIIGVNYDYNKKERNNPTTIGSVIHADEEGTVPINKPNKPTIINVSDESPVYIPDYYVSATGSDSNDGLTELTAWQTLDKFDNGIYPENTVIALKRGDTFTGQIYRESKTTALVITAYGTGNKPIISDARSTHVDLYYSANIIFDNIDFRNATYTNIRLAGSSNITFRYCNIGQGSINGIVSQYDTQICQNLVIDNCTFDTAYNTLDANGASAPEDGLRLTDMTGGEIKNSTFINWGHAGLNYVAASGREVKNMKIHNNHFSLRSNMTYGGSITTDNDSRYNEIYNNTFDGTKSVQLNGDNNHFHHNIVKNAKKRTYGGYNEGIGVAFQYYTTSHSNNNIVENNVIENCASAGIEFMGSNSGNVFGHIVRNNIIKNCGLENNNLGITLINDGTFNDNNTIENNDVYSSATTNTISYHGSIMTIATFNTQTTHGHTITDNISGDPLFVSVSDYHLQSGSTARNAGTTALSTLDYEGNIMDTVTPDLGIYEN